MSSEVRDYAGVDYYTATSNSSSVGTRWFQLWDKHKVASVEQGAKVYSGSRQGYNCVSIQGLTFGSRSDGEFLMTSSGSVASLTWEKVIPRARRVTRVDLQYTFEFPTELDLREVYNKWEIERGKNRSGKIVHNTEQGQTLYVGSRQSNQFGRFYNKSIEANLSKPNVFRLEVELKKPRADAVLDSLYVDMRRNSIRTADIRDYVLSWFEVRKVGIGLDFNTVKPVQLAKSLTCDSKKVTWLKTSVAPTIQDLAQRKKHEAIHEGLGLKSEDYQQLSLISAAQEFKRIDVGREYKSIEGEIKELAKNAETS